MAMNKEAIAVTLLAMFTAAIITLIVLLSRHSLSSGNDAPSPSPIPSFRAAVVNHDSHVKHGHSDLSSSNDAPSPSPIPSFRAGIVNHDSHVKHGHSDQRKKNYNNSLLSLSTKTRAMFIIGDSSVDCGENTLFYPFIRNSLSLIPCSNGFNSSLVPHFLASKMGLSHISSFYEQNGTIEGILNGLNYGSTGATILTALAGPNFQSLSQQQRQLFETIQLLQLQLGEVESNHLVNSSIFYVSLGKEDFINFLFRNTSFIPDFDTASQAFWQLLVNEMTSALRSLYNVGARKIVVMGVLPLGCTPRAVVEWYFSNGRNKRSVRLCVEEINQLVTQYNQRLNERIITLNLEADDAQFVFCDVYQGLMEIISNPQRYGFGDGRATCCGIGWRGAAVGCQSISMACNDTSDHVWWDFYNPTHAVNSLLADSAWTGKTLTDLCRPLSVQGLVDSH